MLESGVVRTTGVGSDQAECRRSQMPHEPSVTSACEEPRSCTLRYSSALLPKSFERPGPKSVSPATYCSGVEVVVWCRWIVDMRSPYWRCHTVHFVVR